MPVSNWMHVDLFTVDQASTLWCGFDPAGFATSFSKRPSEVVAAKQMLISGIRRGEIETDSSQNSLSMIGDFSKTLVSRTSLEAFARKRQLFPAFLFDTLAPIGENERTARSSPPVAVERNRGGRPPEYDWDTFTLEIIRRANSPDGLPETRAELVSDMLAWFQETYAQEPADSSVKTRISKVYKYLEKGKN